jgi:hypothetical protein
MNKDEALDMALEALEAADWYINQLEITLYSADDNGTHEDRLKVQQAITAIKQARSAPVQECLAHGECFDGKRIYTTPPAQRQWVHATEWRGLTETEVDECYESVMFNPDIEPTRVLVYQTIEAKLKEKNT